MIQLLTRFALTFTTDPFDWSLFIPLLIGAIAGAIGVIMWGLYLVFLFLFPIRR